MENEETSWTHQEMRAFFEGMISSTILEHVYKYHEVLFRMNKVIRFRV